MIKNHTEKKYFLILTLLAGIIAVFPQILYQPFLMQGDHGRDLYQYQQTAHGAIPYLDYATDNGPLMPCYYSLFLNTFGDNIQSVLIGYALMILAAGLVIFLIAQHHLAPMTAFLAALWYWAWRGQEFFYTFNHIGALTTGLVTLMFAIKAIHKNDNRFFFSGIFWSLLTFLIRPDIGLAALTSLIVSSLLFQKNSLMRHKSVFTISTITLAGSVIILNLFFPEILGPYFKSIEWSQFFSNLKQLFQIWFNFAAQTQFTSALSLILISLMLAGLIRMWKDREEEGTVHYFKTLFTVMIFIIFFLGEYLLGSRFFRWIWIMPLTFLTMFYLIDAGMRSLTKWARVTAYAVLIITCSGLILSQYAQILVSKEHHAALKINGTYLLMGEDQTLWIDTVQQTTAFIDKHTKPQEPILVLPYDALYGFLARRPLATKETGLFNFNSKQIIREIEEKNIRLILISNRAFHHNEETRFGLLGRDYGQEFVDYLNSRYYLAGTYGPWEKTATPIYNHATRIYLKTDSLPDRINIIDIN
ncbi:MAG: glycosyltransferase family 39 protein [Candidatus Omnitrophota bacterium]